MGDAGHKTQLLQKISDFYFGTTTPNGQEVADIYTKIFTDGLFSYGVSETLKMHSPFHPVYPYYYNYSGKFQIANLMLAFKGEYPLAVELLMYIAKSWINDILGRKPLLTGKIQCILIILNF
jgi:hypothetical protein